MPRLRYNLSTVRVRWCKPTESTISSIAFPVASESFSGPAETNRVSISVRIDIAAETGTPVIAPARGLVSFVGHKGPLGQSVVINHGYGVRTVYGHNSEIHVKIGDEVVRGTLLASVGSTGRSTGPHLHYSVEVRGVARDPLDYVFD